MIFGLEKKLDKQIDSLPDDIKPPFIFVRDKVFPFMRMMVKGFILVTSFNKLSAALGSETAIVTELAIIILILGQQKAASKS